MKALIKIEKAIKFSDTEIQKQKFDQHKETTSTKNIDINKIVVSNKDSFGKTGFKYSICYKDAKKLDLYVCIFQPKMSAYRKDFGKTKHVFFDKR